MDEQLAGHLEGRDVLRDMMKGFPTMYARFSNTPANVVVDGEEATVVSHISAETADGGTIEAHVCNYFRKADGRIAYMRNSHDTVPFTNPNRG